MSSTPPDMYTAAFDQWESVQKCLALAVQDYVDASASLEATLSVSPEDANSQNLQKEAFNRLDSSLLSLDRYEESLCHTRSSLFALRNSCHSLTPIHSLPDELLSIILFLSHQKWIDQDYIIHAAENSPTALASVCTRWRRLLIHTPSFWSELRLGLSGPSSRSLYKQAALWAERSYPESLHIWVAAGDYYDETKEMKSDLDPSQVQHMVDFLTPLMPRIRGINLQCNEDESADPQWFISEILTCWAEFGTLGIAESLQIYAPGGDMTEITIDDPLVLGNLSFQQFERFFRSLRVLHLRNAAPDWAATAFPGLVDLHLNELDMPIMAIECAEILAGCPRLRCLRMEDLSIFPSEPSLPLGVVKLDDLEVLTLYGLNHLALVLGMINSSSDAIRMSIGWEPQDEEFVPTVRSFLERCNVTILHFRNWSSVQHLDPIEWGIFPQMPHLQKLAFTLKSFDIPLSSNSSQTHLNGQVADRWPKLRDLFLDQCQVTSNDICQLLSIRALKNLWVYNIESPDIRFSEDLERLKEEQGRSDVQLKWPNGRPTERWTFAIGETSWEPRVSGKNFVTPPEVQPPL